MSKAVMKQALDALRHGASMEDMNAAAAALQAAIDAPEPYDQTALELCPECGSSDVTLTHEQSFMANTIEHYCHSVKIQDPDSKARCIKCEWQGRHDQLDGYEGDTA